MKNKMSDTEVSNSRILAIAFFVLLLLSYVSAFAASQRGKLQGNRDLANQIESYQVLPGHNYYYSGGAGKPSAILGIHKDFQLVTGQWQSVQISSEQLMKWMSQISPDTTIGAGGYSASYIIAPDGKKAGFWYSFQSSTVIKFPGGNKIEVYTPDLNQPGELEEMIITQEPEIEIEMEMPDMDLDIDLDD